MTYDKTGSGWGRGDALYACRAGAGNCTDFHCVLHRARPGRGHSGAVRDRLHDSGGGEGRGRSRGIIAGRNSSPAGSGCPVDISEAWKNRTLAGYYFGHRPANRFELSAGRDLEVEPAPASGPFNFLVYPLLEVEGRAVPAADGVFVSEDRAVKHLTLATAGHVDHGKSALVQALTGTDPDRLPEEKARGITIDLGFAELPLRRPATGERIEVGIVDVPGHEDFIKNMVAGVGSVDAALLVVAADDGWMPQTEEHLQILEYLGRAAWRGRAEQGGSR